MSRATTIDPVSGDGSSPAACQLRADLGHRRRDPPGPRRRRTARQLLLRMFGRNRAGRARAAPGTPRRSDLRLGLRSAEQDTAMPTGQGCPVPRQPDDPHIVAENTSRRTAHRCEVPGQFEDLGLQVAVRNASPSPEPCSGKVSRYRAEASLATLRVYSADIPRPTMPGGRGRARGGCPGSATSRPGTGPTASGSAAPWSPVQECLVGRTAAWPAPGTRSGALPGDVEQLDLGGQVRAGVPSSRTWSRHLRVTKG